MKKILHLLDFFVALLQHFGNFPLSPRATQPTNTMETPLPTNHDQDTEDLTAWMIESLSYAFENGLEHPSDTQVFEASETGACMVRLRNGRTFRLQLVEVE